MTHAAIPTPAELRAEHDARLAATVIAAVKSVVADLRITPSLRASCVIGTRPIASAVAEKMIAAGWCASIVAQKAADGGEFVVVVSEPDPAVPA